MNRPLLIFTLSVLVASVAVAQPSSVDKRVDVVVTYDKTNAKPMGDAAIPFDRQFKLVIPKFNTAKIKNVHVYETTFKNGRRVWKKDYLDRANNMKMPVADLILRKEDFTVSGDTLSLTIVPLKPSKNFDVIIIRALTGDNFKMALKVNEYIFRNDLAKATSSFSILRTNTTDRLRNFSGIRYLSLHTYIQFYQAKLFTLYKAIHDPANWGTVPWLTALEVMSIQGYVNTGEFKFKDLNWLVRVEKENHVADVFNGLLPVKFTNTTELSDAGDFKSRGENLKASLAFFDTLINAIDRRLAVHNDAPTRAVRTSVYNISNTLRSNTEFLDKQMTPLNKVYDEDEYIREMEALVGTTEAKDIKTQGGNIFTFDLGIANILARDVAGNWKYLPKPYYGVNIYFRAIDKNTRRHDFPRRYAADKKAGPDYNIATVNSFWQHFSMGIGLTFTSTANTQFDHLFNSSTLLIGPGYRFGRFVKFNGGLALLRRVSKNPLISEKKVLPSYYASLAVDIDLVQGVKDFTNMIFK